MCYDSFMTTSALVVFEESNSAIFVRSDGYPQVMLPALARIAQRGELGSLSAVSDYATLFGGVARVDDEQGEPLSVVDGIFGCPYVLSDGEYVSADFLYLVRGNGELICFDDFVPESLGFLSAA